MSSSGVLRQLCHAKAQRLRDTTITEDNLVAGVVASALMFQHGPVSALVFGVDVVTVQQRQAAFFAGQYTVKVQPLNPVPDSASQGRAWWARHFELGVQHDELPFFRAVNWGRDGQPLTVPVYTLGDYVDRHGGGNRTAAPTSWVLTQAVPDYVMLPYVPHCAATTSSSSSAKRTT